MAKKESAGIGKIIGLTALGIVGYKLAKGASAEGSNSDTAATEAANNLNSIANQKLIRGEQGIRGLTGDKGDQGIQGPKGLDGSVLGAVFGTVVINHTTGTDTTATLTHNLNLLNPEQLLSEVVGVAGLKTSAYKIDTFAANSCRIILLASNATGAYTAKAIAAAIPIVPRSWGGSLVDNGAMEFGNINNWSFSAGSNLAIESGTFENFPIGSFLKNASVSTITNVTAVRLRRNRLYKYEGFLASETGSASVGITFYDKDLVPVNYNTSAITFLTLSSVSSATLTNFSIVLGGSGSAAKNLPPTAVFLRIKLITNGTISNDKILFSKLCITEIPLGEAVDYTYAGLPTGQEVFNPGTGARGRYNGTTVNWYTMVP